jgi:hypothetical protein
VPASCHPKMKSFRRVASMSGWSLLCSAVGLLGCARTGLDADGLENRYEDAGPIVPPLAEASLSPDAAAPAPVGSDGACTPFPETCNGIDDDCNGQIDDELPSIPCPGGGARYCVAGRMSACPDRCDVCIPGSQVVCFNSYCLYWGLRTCAADGKGFGPCREEHAPAECAGVASDKKDSPELEQCCVDHGYCCTDRHDLDGDGDRTELLGACGGVLCQP